MLNKHAVVQNIVYTVESPGSFLFLLFFSSSLSSSRWSIRYGKCLYFIILAVNHSLSFMNKTHMIFDRFFFISFVFHALLFNWTTDKIRHAMQYIECVTKKNFFWSVLQNTCFCFNFLSAFSLLFHRLPFVSFESINWNTVLAYYS